MMDRRCQVVAAALLALVVHGEAQAPQGRFAFERPVATAGPGPMRLPVDRPLLTGGAPFRVVRRGGRSVAEAGLADLRFFDAAGRPVPHLLVQPPDVEPRWIVARVLPIQPTKKTSGFEADLGASHPIDALGVEGIPAPFLKRLSVEGSGDRSRWTSLAPEATLFDLPAEKLKQIEVAFEAGAYRYLRVTWNDASSGRVPMPRLVRARDAAVVPPRPQPPLELAFDRQASEPGRSRYRVRLPAPRLPVVAIELDVAGGHVFRQASVAESRFAGVEAAPVELGRATLSRVVQDGVEAASLTVPIAAPTETEVQLLVEDGTNPPLEITRVLGVLADLPGIYLEAPAGEMLARYGDRSLQPPSYDLEAVRQSIDLARLPEAAWGSARALTGTVAAPPPGSVPQAGGPLDAGGFGYVRTIPAASPGLVSLQLDAAALAHSRGPARRFPDVRLLDEAGRQIPYLLERRDEPLELGLTLQPGDSEVAELKRAPGRQLSVYRIDLPYERLPPATLVLETGARIFQRSVQAGIEAPPDRTRRDTRFMVYASGTWRHADRDTAPSPLSLQLPVVTRPTLLIVVDEGDNAPLPIASARLLLPSYRLRYYQPDGGSVRLAYGREDLLVPRYDLSLLAQHVMGAPAQDLVPAAETQTRAARDSAPISPLTFWVLLGGAVVVLVGLILKLARG